MFYLDSQRTLTRRDSSLLLGRRSGSNQDEYRDYDVQSSYRGQSIALTLTDSSTYMKPKPPGSVQKEIVTLLFESMLDSIVDSWTVIVPPKTEENLDEKPVIDVASKKRKSLAGIMKIPKTKRSSRSKFDLNPDEGEVLQHSWWSGPDEKAVICFKNGNKYEGQISMKCMHGDGRFQWADGTVYIGQFKQNEINGKGRIQWKDDTWYEGDFAVNVRHGSGLYVDSRNQTSYTGGWHYGTKHGDGVIFYSKDFKNSYDGCWVYNQRHGFGSREYCAMSGYEGEFDQNVREGKGLIIWPNHDFYRGEWKNGVMSGYGIYLWNAYYNNSMSLPSIIAYRGQWERGARNGYGVLNLGLGLGSYYKGEFKDNKKHGVGKFVTNNGLILQHKKLFIDDNLGSVNDEGDNDSSVPLRNGKRPVDEPYQFDICDSTVGLYYHIQQALNNIDKQDEIRANIINEYIENNKELETDMTAPLKTILPQERRRESVEDLIKFEQTSLLNAIRCYETDLKHIYYKYATICNTEEIHFRPILIRLYLWQLYYDCNVHDKGLTLVEIDNLFYQNPEWIARTPHSPFEKIYFWQFVHSLITVASKLYAKRQLPGRRPDTILSTAFRTFMESEILPCAGRCKGRLVNMYGTFVPLKCLYELYRSLGDPHTVRTFLCAVRRPPHCLVTPQPELIEPSDESVPLGRNAYIFADEMTFVTDDNILPEEVELGDEYQSLKLFNFGNLPSKTIIKLFANVFPQLYVTNKIMDLNIEITFFEFFEVFIACCEESNRLKDEEEMLQNLVADAPNVVSRIGRTK